MLASHFGVTVSRLGRVMVIAAGSSTWDAVPTTKSRTEIQVPVFSPAKLWLSWAFRELVSEWKVSVCLFLL